MENSVLWGMKRAERVYKMKRIAILLLALFLPLVSISEQSKLQVTEEALGDYGFLSTIRESEDCTRRNPLKMMETVHFVLNGVDVYMKVHRCHVGENANRIMEDSMFFTASPFTSPYIVDFRIMTADNGSDVEISISEYDFEVYTPYWKKEEKAYFFDIPYRQDSYQGYPGSFGRFSFVTTTIKDESRYLKFKPMLGDDLIIWIDPMNQYYQ